MPFGGSLLLPLRPFVEDAFPATTPQEVDERFSTLLNQVLPDFVVNDHTLFVAFIRAYYEYMEQHGNPRAEAVRLETYTDIDQTLDSFLQFFKSTYLYDFPENLSDGINEKQLVKNIKTYYGDKGNPRSLDLLFRILYKTNADVFFPRDDIITLSESSYENETFLKTTRVNGSNLLDFVGGNIFQYSEDQNSSSRIVASGFIDDITFKEENGIDHALIKVVAKFGNFVSNHEVIFSIDGQNNIRETPFDILSTLGLAVVAGVTQDGIGYDQDDQVIIRDSNNKIVGTTELLSVSPIGEIISVSPVKTDKIYLSSATYDIEILTAGGTGGILEIVSKNPEISSARTFTTPKSLLSSQSFIQNNFSYQNFSYRIKSDVQLKSYAGIVKKLFHPAGSMMLGEYNFNEISVAGGLTTDIDQFSNIPILTARIGNYLPYTFASTMDLRGDTAGSTFADYYPYGWDGVTAATWGEFDAQGNAVTHDSFQFFGITAQIGGPFYSGDNAGLNSPLRLLKIAAGADVTNFPLLPGYTSEINPQSIMTSTDNRLSDFFIIYKHPNNLIVSDNFTARQAASVNKNYTLDSTRNKLKSSFTTVTFAITNVNTGTGTVDGLTVGDRIRQSIPGQPAATGEITNIETVLGSATPGGISNYYGGGGLSNIDISETQQVAGIFAQVDLQTPSDPSILLASEFTYESQTVLTVKMLNGSFSNALKGNEIADKYVCTNGKGTNFLIAGFRGTEQIIVEESEEDLSFGNVRIDDFLNRMKRPEV